MDDRMAYLKSLLVPYTWHDFAFDVVRGCAHTPVDTLYIKDIMFEAGHGVHLGHPAMAVMAEDKFVVIRYLPEPTNYTAPLNPKAPMKSGYMYRLSDSILKTKVIRDTET